MRRLNSIFCFEMKIVLYNPTTECLNNYMRRLKSIFSIKLKFVLYKRYKIKMI